MGKVKRFDPWTDMWGVFGGMNQKATGDWVDYDDYAKLEATIAELTRERDELRVRVIELENAVGRAIGGIKSPYDYALKTLKKALSPKAQL